MSRQKLHSKVQKLAEQNSKSLKDEPIKTTEWKSTKNGIIAISSCMPTSTIDDLLRDMRNVITTIFNMVLDA